MLSWAAHRNFGSEGAVGDAFISLGTSSQLLLTTADYRLNPGALVHALADALPGRWFQMAAMLNGALVLPGRPVWRASVTSARRSRR